MTETESEDSLYRLYENCDPSLLQRTRQAVGMDEGVLARRACLSTAQVRQLASGGDGLFYSITIKRQAYKRVMMVLGAEPPTHLPYSHKPDAGAQDSQVNQKDTIDSIVALSSKSEYLERQPVKDFFLDLRFRLIEHRQFLAALLFLMLALLVMVWNWQTLRQAASAPILSTEKTDAKEAASASPAPVPTAPSAVVAPASVATVPNVATPPATIASAVQAMASTSVSNKSVQSGGACEFADKLAQTVSASASRPSNYVYVVSPTDTTVCVVDGSKKATVLNLKSNEGRSVYGTPPWQVSGNGLKDTQIFFQGVRVKGPEGHELHFALIEKPTSP